MNRNSASYLSHPNLEKHQAGRFSPPGSRSPGEAKILPTMASVMAIAVLGVFLASSASWQSHASGNYFQQKIFAHKSIHKKTNYNARVIRASIGRDVSPGRLDRSFRSPGAKVINVARVLEARRKSQRRHKKGFKVTIHSNSPTVSGPAAEHMRLLNRDGYGLVVPDIGEMNCQAEYDCIIRLGTSPSSPKIIVVGEKRSVPGRDSAANPGPKIIHPPS